MILDEVLCDLDSPISYSCDCDGPWKMEAAVWRAVHMTAQQNNCARRPSRYVLVQAVIRKTKQKQNTNLHSCQLSCSCCPSSQVVVALSLLALIWKNVQPFTPHPPCTFFFFFFEVQISLHTLIPLFMPGSVHSGSASWHNCGRMFPDKYARTAAQSAHSDFVGSWVYMWFGVTFHLHCWQND